MSTITDWAQKYGVRPQGVIHVGACIGEERDEWAALTQRVAWIEANPALWEQLERNVVPMGHEVVRAAAGTAAGTLTLHVSPHVHCSSMMPLVRHATHYPHIGYSHDVQVPVRALDEVFAGRHQEFDYLYLDTQGYEGQVLMGAQQLLPHVRWIYAEYNNEELYGGCWLMPELTRWLGERGFGLKEIETLHPAWGNAFWVRER